MLFLADDTMLPIKIDTIVEVVYYVHKSFPVVGVMLLTAAADICFGLCAACVTKSLSSTISQKGMVKKVAQLLWVGLGCALEPHTGGFPLGGPIAVCFIITNLISITENSARAGLPVPKPIVDCLQRIRDNEKASLATPVPPNSAVAINRASHVDIHTTDTPKESGVHKAGSESVVIVSQKPVDSEKK